MLSDIATDMEQAVAGRGRRADAVSEGRDPSKINFTMSEDNVRMQIQQPWVVIGTDAGGYDPDSTKTRRAPARVRHAIRASSAATCASRSCSRSRTRCGR